MRDSSAMGSSPHRASAGQTVLGGEKSGVEPDCVLAKDGVGLLLLFDQLKLVAFRAVDEGDLAAGAGDGGAVAEGIAFLF
jgi:hypothetical protein